MQESFEYTINLTQYEKHGMELSKAVTTPGDIVVSVGGDGSTFDVLNGLQEGVGLDHTLELAMSNDWHTGTLPN